MAKNNNDDIASILARLNNLEENYSNLTIVASQHAQGLDKLSRVVEIQTGTLINLLASSENQFELLEEVANGISELKSANQEAQILLGTQLDNSNQNTGGAI